MFNYLSRNRKWLSIISLICAVVVFVQLVHFGHLIFTNENVYYYALSSIVQGFVALIAFLGALAVFKIQGHDQMMQKLSDGIEQAVSYYRGSAAATYDPIDMMIECEKILQEKGEDYGHSRAQIEKTYKKMEKIQTNKNEIRNAVVDFTVFSFLNVGLALVCLLFTPLFVLYWYVGFSLVVVSLGLSVFNLLRAFVVVRRTMGYGFSI